MKLPRMQSVHARGVTPVDADHSTAEISTHVVSHRGMDFVMMHAEGITTGLVGAPSEDREPTDEARIAVSLWRGPEGRETHGKALTCIITPEFARSIAASLVRLADDREGVAAAFAASALHKAAGK